jgi:hypothetical protein
MTRCLVVRQTPQQAWPNEVFGVLWRCAHFDALAAGDS